MLNVDGVVERGKVIVAKLIRCRKSVNRRMWRVRIAELGPASNIAGSVRIHSPRNVKIGHDSHVNHFVHIWGGGGVVIGDHVLVASHVVITSQSHAVDAVARNLLYRDTDVMAPVVIERNVWIGANACILPGVTIGRDSVVAAGAVVTKSVPERSLVMGVPARVVRRL